MEGDRIVNLVGVALLLGLVVSVAVVALAGVTAPSNRQVDTPAANWTVERVNATHVRIAHAGGEPVRTENVVVTVDGTARRVTWSGVVAEGDRGVFRAAAGKTVRLYWVGGRGDRVLLRIWAP